jgi:ABC-type nitrate/sulfonate/bicarbonate transport system substrate-binding protein
MARSLVVALAALLAIVVVIAGCGGGGSSSSGSTVGEAETGTNTGGGEGETESNGGEEESEAGSGELEKVKVGAASYDSAFAPFYVGKAKGFFEKHGIELEMVQVGAEAAPSLVSGHIDVDAGGINEPFPIVQQGKKIQIINGTYGGGVVGFVAGSVNNIKECQKMATFTEGQQTYGWSVNYEEFFHANYELVSQTDFVNIPSVLAAGRTDCATGTYGILQPVVAEGKAKFLVDPREKQKMPPNLTTMPEAGMYAMTSELEEHPETITKLLEGYNESVEYFEQTEPSVLAKETLEADKGFGVVPESILAEGIEVNKEFFSPEHGLISEEGYKTILEFSETAGLDYVSGPEFSYENMVNMSFLEEATK